MLDTMYVANIATANVGPDYGGGMFFSSNKENILSGKLNFMVRLDTIARISTDIKIGAMVQNRSRNFTARQLGYTTYGIVGGAVSFDQSLLYLPEDSIFAPENMGLISPGKGGFKLTDGTKPSDAYQASSDLYSAYLMLDNKFGEKVRLNWGARLEQFTQLLTAMRADETDLSIDTKKMDVLPSFNLIVSPTKKQNIRLSGSQTLNRPEYRELAPFAFYDFNTQFVLSGNDSLLRCRITNADLRYEWYPGNNQILSAGVFYKYFENPIEQIARPDVANEISYKNAPTATNYGFELEFRTVIGSLFKVDSSSFLNNLTLFSNLSIIRSIVDVSDNVGTLYETRPLQGQSPYVFNGGIFFQDKRNKMNYSLNINRVGPRIYILGSIIQPDIWEKSRTFLDFQITKAFFKEKFEVKLNIQNILAQDLVFYQNNYATEKKAKSLKRFANSLFLADPNNRNGFDKDVDDLVWRTKFGSTFSLVLTYKF
jgi:TonB-dependent receptor